MPLVITVAFPTGVLRPLLMREGLARLPCGTVKLFAAGLLFRDDSSWKYWCRREIKKRRLQSASKPHSDVINCTVIPMHVLRRISLLRNCLDANKNAGIEKGLS